MTEACLGLRLLLGREGGGSGRNRCMVHRCNRLRFDQPWFCFFFFFALLGGLLGVILFCCFSRLLKQIQATCEKSAKDIATLKGKEDASQNISTSILLESKRKHNKAVDSK